MLSDAASSDRVHERFFDLVEDENTGKQQQDSDADGKQHVSPDDGALTKEHHLDRFDWHGHRVQRSDPPPFFWNLRKWVDNRCCVHPNLDDESAQETEVPVLRR